MATQLPLDIRLREDATFANYIGEAGARLASSGGFVWVHGPPGTGKSHLLQAVCHAMREAGGEAMFLQEPAEHDAEVLTGLERYQAICLDGVEAVLGNRTWEIALFHLVNAARDSGRRLVVSAEMPPARAPAILPDLASRLRAADIIGTDRLDDARKRRLLQEKAARQGFELADDVAAYILSRASRSPRELVDLLAAIERDSLRHQRKVTIPFVRQVMGIS